MTEEEFVAILIKGDWHHSQGEKYYEVKTENLSFVVLKEDSDSWKITIRNSSQAILITGSLAQRLDARTSRYWQDYYLDQDRKREERNQSVLETWFRG